ncbi:MAG TPA: winged helix-turn-helix domain-containing protein [Pyrinomonadaceae bacterium]|nr:winged helix-turn-helix domain-containing protein [Pyrinomonadaceae bacterium]
MSDLPKKVFEFGPFRLDCAERVLLRDGQTVPLTLKAFDVLLVLVEKNGHLVEKDELMNRVWPGSFVEEGNLKVTVSMLRKALDDNQPENRFIETVPRRGYRFVASVRELSTETAEVIVRERTTATITVEGGETSARPAERKALVAQERNRRRVWQVGIAGAAVLGLAIAGLYVWRNRAPSPEVKSVAVLPFRPLVAENRDEALELGMADALITKLSNLKQIVVRPTSSILKYQDNQQDPLAIGREQKVDLLLEGKVQRAADNIRVTVQLVRVADGLPVWAGKFDEKFTNIFSVQDSISRQVADALVSQLSGEQRQQLAKRYTDNVEAYNLYLKGRFFWNKFTPDGLEKAIDYYKQAIALDPNYALAYTGLSVAYNVQGAFGVVPPAQTWIDARRTAQRAVELDDTLAEAHSALGGVKLLYEWDWAAAEKELKRAIELNPNYAEAHELYGFYFWVVRDFEKAFSEIKRALELSPTSPILTLDLATTFYYEGKYGEAIDAYRTVRELDPNMLGLLFIPAQAYERNRQYDRAIEECERDISAFGRDPGVLSALGYAYGNSGNHDKAGEIIRELETKWKERYFSPLIIALAHTGAGNKDGAFVWLTKAFESRDPQLIWLTVEPQFESLHSDSRFQALVRQMGLSQAPQAP